MLANATKPHLRDLARLVRRVELEEAADDEATRLRRRQAVIAGLALTAHGVAPRARQSSSRRSPRVVPGQEPRVGAAGAGSRPAA